jgi:hypothetical protein
MEPSRIDMLNRYLHAVGFWLPRHQKEDILAELAEDLHSQIDDREAELGRPLEETDIVPILKQRGRPVFVAGKFLPQQRLIGPVLYPIYILVLKIVALFYLLPWVLIWLGMLIFDRVQTRFHIGVGSLGTLWAQAFMQFGIITLIFAVIERLSTASPVLNDWDPRKLPKVRAPQVSKERCNAIAGIIFGIVGFFWLLAVPSFPFLILWGATSFLKAAPIWHSVYVPILLLSLARVAENIITLVRPHTDWFRPAFGFATTAGTLWVIYMLLQTRVYFLPVSPQFAQVSAAMNLAVLICAFCSAFGLFIGLFVYAWRAILAFLHPTGSPATRIA